MIMNKITKLWNYLLHNRNLLGLAILSRIAWLFPDKLFLKLLFRLHLGYPLNLDNPRTFSEKLQWLKLYNRRPEYTRMVDKYEVKKYVADLIGEEYIIPTLGVWDRVEDIDFATLPNQFVLKTTHSGGNTGVVICKDKATFDINACKKKLQKSLHDNIYKSLREWPYKNVKPRIIAEQFLSDDFNSDLPDYKFFCFDGVPHYCQVIKDRNSEETIDFYDTEWNLQEFIGLLATKHSNNEIDKPFNFKIMIVIARYLSRNIPFSRVDLYEINGKVYFGEITFFPASGFGKFSPHEWNYTLGNLIKLPEDKIC